MATIYFKNESEIKVIQEVVEILQKRTVEGCGRFQSFINQEGKTTLIINIEEIVCITTD
jgi:hypothetical protein